MVILINVIQHNREIWATNSSTHKTYKNDFKKRRRKPWQVLFHIKRLDTGVWPGYGAQWLGSLRAQRRRELWHHDWPYYSRGKLPHRWSWGPWGSMGPHHNHCACPQQDFRTSSPRPLRVQNPRWCRLVSLLKQWQLQALILLLHPHPHIQGPQQHPHLFQMWPYNAHHYGTCFNTWGWAPGP